MLKGLLITKVMMRGKLYAVGVGPGDPELLTLKAVKAIRMADVIACPAKGDAPGLAYQIAKEAFPEICSKETQLLHFPMSAEGKQKAHVEAAEEIISGLQKGRNIAFLTLGDPGFYSTFTYVSKIITEKGYDIEIISGVPSFCAAAARLQLSLASGGGSVLISAGEYRDFPGTVIVMKAGSRLRSLKKQITAKGKKAYLVENCGMESEKIYSDIPSMPDQTGYFSLLIIE